MTDHDPKNPPEPAENGPHAGAHAPDGPNPPDDPPDPPAGHTEPHSHTTHKTRAPIDYWRPCDAHRTDGHPCKAPAMRGQRVCRVHGGSAPQALAGARRRLAAMVDPALDQLERVMAGSEKDADRMRAIENVLDRIGIPRRSEVQVDSDQLRADIEQRLAELDEADDPDPDGVESPGDESPPESPGEPPDDPPEVPDGQPETGETEEA